MHNPDTQGARPGTAAQGAQEEWLNRYGASLMGVFGAPQRVLVRGSGCYVEDADGKQYLDLLGGIAVNSLGHAHPALVAAVSDQLATLGHVSNFFTSLPQVELAERLLALADAPQGSKVFFANSGAEANEAAFKLARRNSDPAAGRTRILALEGAFHGRTMGALALTAKPAYREPFEPLPGGVEHLPFGDIDALLAAVDETVAAVFLEPIQGEAGVRMLPEGYLQAAREATRAAGALLVIDEVQTGIGRTGKWFASEGVLPDAMTLAKGLGGGFPVGAMITFGERTSGLLAAGMHGTTFGGNPVAAAAALATLSVLESVLANVRATGDYLRRELAALDFVAEVRGEGLLIGIDLVDDVAPAVVAAALEAGYIINSTGAATLRLAPPLILAQEQAGTFLDALPGILRAARARVADAGAASSAPAAPTAPDSVAGATGTIIEGKP
ncbi:acetylornithine transaminase [Arthrobacter sp. zg-Y179]|uniref:acetylornithine transaminase n=1 Tax=Arthrobacter sp. zg-Y179 TaxID=2894188 RepID=UPI001E64CE43|nr:acetylornithine transaminase [Arthrobacter sp. zg-Y179]MCC9175883.1 acetylornithine transaminase [Arthrobacter sp. zg-Y179]